LTALARESFWRDTVLIWGLATVGLSHYCLFWFWISSRIKFSVFKVWLRSETSYSAFVPVGCIRIFLYQTFKSLLSDVCWLWARFYWIFIIVCSIFCCIFYLS
jgi:hypothetical protein